MSIKPTVMKCDGSVVPEVSILCPTFNHENYIEDALNGFLIQETNFPFEIIIHDDASTDNTRKILLEWKNRYPDKICLILEAENQFQKRVSVLQKFMLPQAKGKYIAVCEGDDFWTDPHKLQIQYDAMEAHPEASCCVCDVEEYDNIEQKKTGKVYCAENIADSGLIPQPTVIGMILPEYPFQTSGYFFPRSLLLTPENDDERLLFSIWMDRAVLLSCACRGGFYYVKKSMSCYRVNVSGSISTVWSQNAEVFRSTRKIHIAIYQLFDAATYGRFHEAVQEVIKHWQLEYDRSVIGQLINEGKYSALWSKYHGTKAFSLYVPSRVKVAAFLHLLPLFKQIYKRIAR